MLTAGRRRLNKLWRIQHGELAVEFFGGLVVGTGGLDWVIEIADVNFFPVIAEVDLPLLSSFVPEDALEFFVGFLTLTVAGILGDSARAEIGFSIIEAIMVYVVNDHAIRNHDDFPVHKYGFRFSPASSVTGGAAGAGLPFVLAESLIIIGVNDGEFALREWNFPECVAVAQAPIEKNNQNDGFYHPLRNMHDNVDVSRPDKKIKYQKSKCKNVTRRNVIDY